MNAGHDALLHVHGIVMLTATVQRKWCSYQKQKLGEIQKLAEGPTAGGDKIGQRIPWSCVCQRRTKSGTKRVMGVLLDAKVANGYYGIEMEELGGVSYFFQFLVGGIWLYSHPVDSCHWLGPQRKETPKI